MKIIKTALLLSMFFSSAAFSIEKDAPIVVDLHPYLPIPATSIFAPLGYGPDWGVVYASGTVVNRWPGGRKSDGYLLAGIGLGDSDRLIGGSLNVLVDSVGFRNEHFGQNTLLSGAIYHWFGPNTSVAFGISNVVGSGVFNRFSNGYYGSATQLIPLAPGQENPIPVALTLGFGTGNFVTPLEFRRGNDSKVSGFGAVAVNPLKYLTLIADYTGQILTAGASLIPVPTFPLAVTGYVSNLAGADRAPGGVTYGLSVGVGYSFL